jgi:hypothetical protein
VKLPRDSTPQGNILQQRAHDLEARWKQLCALYLPGGAKTSIWRYARANRVNQPAAGWKLHISATVLNAPDILQRVAPALVARGIPFKAPQSLFEIAKLNAGLDYGYSQIGKIITVYPATDEEAVQLCRRLHALTRNFTAPIVPFDLRFAETGNVYYRYGAFEHFEISRRGRKISAVRGPDGRLVRDVREEPHPAWVSDPIAAHRPKPTTPREPVPSSLRVMKVLAQRGKGGVYVALDLRSHEPRLCLLKEGRKNGELTWQGRDGAWRVRNEKRVLSRLAAAGVAVPRVLSSFDLGGNYYLLIEFLDGETLHDQLLSRPRRLALTQVLDYGMQLAQFLKQMHEAGWVWRDCKPKNIIVTRDRRLVPIDFEGATPVGRPDPQRWSTPGFSAPKPIADKATSAVADDAYALGAVMFLLLTGRTYDPAQPLAIQKLRRNVPRRLRQLVSSLLVLDATARPCVESVCADLTILLKSKRMMTLRQHASAAGPAS